MSGKPATRNSQASSLRDTASPSVSESENGRESDAQRSTPKFYPKGSEEGHEIARSSRQTGGPSPAISTLDNDLSQAARARKNQDLKAKKRDPMNEETPLPSKSFTQPGLTGRRDRPLVGQTPNRKFDNLGNNLEGAEEIKNVESERREIPLEDRLRNVRDRFTDISEALCCGICGLAFISPVQVASPDCNHVFCEPCLRDRLADDKDVCPECGFVFQESMLIPHNILRQVIMDQPILCYYEPLGCDQIPKFRDLQKHEKHCQHNPDRTVDCECGLEIYITDYPIHLEETCSEHQIACPHGCESMFKRKLLADHEGKQCPLRPVRCDFASFGCNYKGAAATMALHAKDNFQSHMGMMLQKMQKIELDNAQLRTAVANGRTPGMDRTILLDQIHAMRAQEGRQNASVKQQMAADTNLDHVEAELALGKRSAPMEPSYNHSVWNTTAEPKAVIESRAGEFVFCRPYGVHFVDTETLIISDYKQAIVFDPTTLNARGYLEPSVHHFFRPRGIATDPTHQYTFLVDSQNDCVHVFHTRSLDFLMSFGKEVGMNYPRGIACVSNKIYVADSKNKKIQVFQCKHPSYPYLGAIHDDSGEIDQMNASRYGQVYATVNTMVDSYVSVVDGYAAKYESNFGMKGKELGQFEPARGVAIDGNNFVYVTTNNKYKVQVFSRNLKAAHGELGSEATTPNLEVVPIAHFGGDKLLHPSGIDILTSANSCLLAVADEVTEKVYLY